MSMGIPVGSGAFLRFIACKGLMKSRAREKVVSTDRVRGVEDEWGCHRPIYTQNVGCAMFAKSVDEMMWFRYSLF